MQRILSALFIAGILLSLLLVGCSDRPPVAPTESSPQDLPPLQKVERVPGSYIVTLKATALGDVPSIARGLVQAFGGRLGFVYQHALRGFSLQLPDALAEALKNHPFVESVEPDGIAYAFVQTLPWGIDRIDADVSSTLAGNGSGSVNGVRVYILDTGAQLNHPDLNIAGSVDFTGKGTAADGHGHGTHVSGTVGAKDNADYVVGVAPDVALYALKVLNDQGSGSFSQITAGVDYVTGQKQNNSSIPMVANMSLGGYVGTTAYNTLDRAIVNSIKAGVVYCIAAGNSTRDAKWYSPAHVVEAITVGAYDSNNRFATFSNYGSILDLNAPGVSVLSTWIGSSTKTISGTSMATPHVAGAAALYLSSNPTKTSQQVRDQLVADGRATVTNVRPSTTNKTVYAGKY